MKVNRTVNLYGTLGVILYLFLSAPIIRSLLFGEKAKILDVFGGEVATTDKHLSVITKYVLIVPYTLNEYIFKVFDLANFNILVFVLMVPIVFRYFKFSSNYKDFIKLAFLFSPAPLLFLSTFNKEIILVFSLFLSFGYASDLKLRNKPLYFIGYSVFLRPYLFWVPFFLKLKNVLKGLGFVLIAFLVLVLNSFTGPIVFKIFNRRLVESNYSASSEIIQNTVVVDFITLIHSLIEVLPQFVFPFILEPSVKNLYLQVYLFFMIYIGLIYRNIYSKLMLLIILLYIILDPDLGAFFRHLASFFVIFPLALGLKREEYEK